MRRVLSGVAAIAFACAAGTMAIAQTAPASPNTPPTANGQVDPNSQNGNVQLPTKGTGNVDTGINGTTAPSNTNGTMPTGMNQNGQLGPNGQNGTMPMQTKGTGNANGQLDSSGQTSPAMQMNGSGQMVPLHPANWQYELMAKQYHWNTVPGSNGP